MLRRLGLVIAICSLSCWLCAQADSLDVMIESDSLATEMENTSKAEILQWVEDHQNLPFALPSRYVPLQCEAGDLYQSNAFFIGRPDLSQPVRMGFEQLTGAFNASLYHGYYLSFYPRMGNRHRGYETEIYPYEPTLSYIKGGLGEYEHHYARVALMKNNLAGLKDCYYQGDMLAQNGLWTDIISAETSHKHYFSIPLKSLSLSAEYANWNKDVSMTELQPVYWQITNFTITHRLNHVYASLTHPWAEISILHSEEKAAALPFSKTLVNENTQLKLAHSRDHGTWKYFASYEHAISEANFETARAFGQESYQNKLSFSWDSYPYAGLELDLELLDWERGRLAGELTFPVAGSWLGAYYRMKMGEEDYSEQVEDIYNPGSRMAMLSLDTRREQAAFFRYELMGISTLISLGSRQIKQFAGDNYLSFAKEQPFMRLGMDVNQHWGNWQLTANPRWSWHQPIDNLCESPEFSFQSVQHLSYHLAHGNSLLAGFAAYGHTGYNVASLSIPYVVEASTVIDAWLGLGIESRFDFVLGMKNILSSTLYGAAPVPMSLFAQLSWFFLN